jgi:hypothetical protein
VPILWKSTTLELRLRRDYGAPRQDRCFRVERGVSVEAHYMLGKGDTRSSDRAPTSRPLSVRFERPPTADVRDLPSRTKSKSPRLDGDESVDTTTPRRAALVAVAALDADLDRRPSRNATGGTVCPPPQSLGVAIVVGTAPWGAMAGGLSLPRDGVC